MTVIFTNSDFWIESHILAWAAVVTILVQDVTLNKAGRFVGASISLDGDSPIDGRNVVVMRNTDDTEITYGQAITAIRTEIAVNSPRTFGVKLLVYMRK